MKLRSLASVLALATAAPFAAAETQLDTWTVSPSGTFQVQNRVGADPGSLAAIFVGFEENFAFGDGIFLGFGLVGPSGQRTFSRLVPDPASMPVNFELYFRTYTYSAGSGYGVSNDTHLMLQPTPCERLDMDWRPGVIQLETGEEVTDQWASLGIHVSAFNKTPGHPNKAIIFDSANPTGEDPDLGTPGFGPDNDTALGKLLIVAEDDVDLGNDGLVDDPDDESGGGIVVFEFDRPTILCSITIVDIDDGTRSELRCISGPDTVMTLPVADMGDNSVQRIGFPFEPVDRLEIDFERSGGIAELTFVPCPEFVEWDSTLTGVPTGLRVGEWVTDQLRPTAGFTVSAQNAIASHPDKAILFDTQNPTGGDPDLATPGPGAGNLIPRGMMLIIAENDFDGDNDGLVDVPDDEAKGGVLSIDFDFDIVWERATVLDVDGSEVSWFEAFDAADQSLGSWPLANLGDNALQTVNPQISGVRRIELNLGGSGALSDLRYCLDLGEPEGPELQ